MANMCENILFISTEDESNIQEIINFLKKYDFNYEVNDEWTIDAWFETRWTFNEDLMNELFNSIPNKEDIYMRCLSVEYGCLYHALWICDEHGWGEV